VLTYDANGTLDAALVLRTVFQRDGHCWLQAGAGIVQQSRPEREFEETCEKLRSVAGCLVPRTAGPETGTAGPGTEEATAGAERGAAATIPGPVGETPLNARAR
jgi:anthranilate synthase component 1/salicylate synthetase